MARRWFSRTGLTLESEKIDLITHALTDAKLNGRRLLTNADILPVEEIESQSVADFQLSTSLTAISFAVPFSPASTTGISQPNATTIQITKKGLYIFEVQLSSDTNGYCEIIAVKNGSNYDGQNCVGYKVGAALYTAWTAFFFFSQTTDTTVQFVFQVRADSLPTSGTTMRALSDLTVSHFSYPAQ